MGLLTGLITLPLAPVRGVAWLASQVLDQATQQQYDPAEVYLQLAELDAAREAGDITADQCAAAEDALVARLMRARGEINRLAEAGSD